MQCFLLKLLVIVESFTEELQCILCLAVSWVLFCCWRLLSFSACLCCGIFPALPLEIGATESHWALSFSHITPPFAAKTQFYPSVNPVTVFISPQELIKMNSYDNIEANTRTSPSPTWQGLKGKRKGRYLRCWLSGIMHVSRKFG